MPTGLPPLEVKVPRIEDEIEHAWSDYCADAGRDDSLQRNVFEAGFRAARTSMIREF